MRPAAKREKRRNAEERAIELRAQRKVYRREDWYPKWNATQRAAEREAAKPRPPQNLACLHGAYDCDWCNGREPPERWELGPRDDWLRWIR